MPDTKISALTDAGALAGTELVPLANGAANERTTVQAIANLGRGLWTPVMSVVPTSTNTGLTTWGNQDGSSVADTAVGVAILRPSGAGDDLWSIRYKAAPATPYTIKALLALTHISPDVASNNASLGFGWYDGTKMHLIRVFEDQAQATGIYVSRYSTLTAFSAHDFVGQAGQTSKLLWLALNDDGTNVAFRFSSDGVNYVDIFTVAKASGYLGASGYSNVMFGVASKASISYATLMSWTQS